MLSNSIRSGSNEQLTAGQLFLIQSLVPIFKIQGGIRQCSILFSPDIEESAEIATEFSKHLKTPVILNAQSSGGGKNEFDQPSNLVLILQDNLTVSEALNTTLRNHETAFVVVTFSVENVAKRMRQFWDSRIISGYVLLIYKETETYELFGFEPRNSSLEIRPRKSVSLVNVFDMHGSPMNISVVNLPPPVILNLENASVVGGIEGKILLEVAKKFNFKPLFATPLDGEMWGWLYPKAAGVLGEIFSGHSGFGFGFLAITAPRLEVFDQICGYNPMECVTWAVPKKLLRSKDDKGCFKVDPSELNPTFGVLCFGFFAQGPDFVSLDRNFGAGVATVPWLDVLVTEFSWETWLAIANSSLALILFSLLVDGQGIVLAMIRFFAGSIGIPVPPTLLLPRDSSRILLLTLIWSSFILSITYQSSMGSKLAVPPTLPDINTFSELLESSLNITGIYNTILLMKETKDLNIRAIAERSTPTTALLSDILRQIVRNRDVAYMRQGTTFRYNAIIDPVSQSGIHIMKDCAFSYYPSFTLSKWSPYYRGASETIQYLFQSGIIGHWGSDLMPEYPAEPEPPTPLSIKHLFGVFVLLKAGYAVAAVVFALENLFAFLHIKKLKGIKKGMH